MAALNNHETSPMKRNVKSPLALTATLTVFTMTTLCLLTGCQSQVGKTAISPAHSSQHSSSFPSLSTGFSSFNASNNTTDSNTKKGSRIQTTSSIHHKRINVRQETLYSPREGVLCDRFFCADPKGISYSLTLHFLGRNAATRLHDEGSFDTTAFTFENGIFCDTREKLCRDNRYYDQQGHHNGKVNQADTKRLFSRYWEEYSSNGQVEKRESYT